MPEHHDAVDASELSLTSVELIAARFLEEIERLVAAHPELEGKDHPEVAALLREGEMILRSEIDPVYRAALRDKPEQLAEWDAIMRGWM